MQITTAPGVKVGQAPAHPAATNAPTATGVTEEGIDRCDPGEVSMPSYIYWLLWPFATSYLTPACSCAITSARPPVAATKTLLFTTYTSNSVGY